VFGRKACCGLQGGTFGGAEAFILPSTSGLACGSWDIGPWREMAQHVRSFVDTPTKEGHLSPLRHF
jgi:hypothetical protein